LAKLTNADMMPGWNKRVYKSIISWAVRQDLWQKWAAIFNNRESYLGKMGKDAAYNFFLDNKKDMLEGTQVLWEEKESYYELMVLREQESELSFDSEKQNEPTSSKESLFNPDEFHYWSDSYRSAEELLNYLGTNAQFFGSCDPAMGESNGKGDFCAITVLVRDKRDGTLYILEADIKRRKPDEAIADIFSYCRRYKFCKFAVEGNYFQDYMVKDMEKKAKEQAIYTASFVSIKNTANKKERIQCLQPLTKNGGLQFNRVHKILIEQFRYFPKAKFDDGPDSIQMAVEICSEQITEFSYGFAGDGPLQQKTAEQLAKEQQLYPNAQGLVPYGWYSWHRLY
jgi:predicted phage terminase large subunit-like protein